MLAFRRLCEAIEAEGSAALVTLARVWGSSPREAGARMVVRPSGGFHGTIGGGALEWVALEAALAALKSGRGPAARRSLALGPELAQCCGGRVDWRIEIFDARDRDALGALNSGPAALRDLENALTEVMIAFRAGRASTFGSIFRPRVDRILFAATKADHLHHTSHDRLEDVLRVLTGKAIARAKGVHTVHHIPRIQFDSPLLQ